MSNYLKNTLNKKIVKKKLFLLLFLFVLISTLSVLKPGKAYFLLWKN
jgi:hypothetical protein